MTSTQVTVPGAVVEVRQPIDPTRWFALLFGLVTLTAALIVALGATDVLEPASTVALFSVPAAIVYGPTKGPPPPTGGEPIGSIGSVEMSDIARARFRRPLPVWSAVPAGSVFRARRPTTTPFVASNDDAFNSAAAPAPSAAAADVPLIVA